MRRLKLFVPLASLIAITAPLTGQTEVEPRPVIRLVEFESAVTPISAHRITKAIDDAEREGDELVLIELDTPGGLVASMEKIVKRMLSAEVPVVVWVGPSGAKAASAGFFILISADVAAMAPGTRTGAASTVYGPGQQSREDDVLLRKSNEDLAALIRSIADRRGRDVEAAELAVFEAKSYEEQVAIDKGLADVIAASRDELLEVLDRREIARFDGTTTVLRTADAEFAVTEFSLRHEFMELLAIPQVAAFLFLAGLLGIYIEFTHPGVVFPGVVGAICLLLFALSAQVLPISTIGVLLIVLALIMFILEIKVTSYGMLTLGGVAALAVGGWMLVDGPIPELRVPPSFIVPLVVGVSAICIFILRLALRAQSVEVASGREGLRGEIGTVQQELAPDGKVFVRGEFWNAVAEGDARIPVGTRVQVIEVDEMTLKVAPATSTGSARVLTLEEK